MSTQRDHVDPLLEEIPITSSGEEIDLQGPRPRHEDCREDVPQDERGRC